VSIVPDAFDFKRYQAGAKQNADVVRTTKLDLVDAFYGEKMKGDPLPWAKTYDSVVLRPSEVTLWPGISGHGKSLVVTQVAFHLSMIGKRVGIVSLEMRPVTTLARAARQIAGSDRPTPEWLEGFKTWAFDRVFLMGTQGIVQPDRVLDFCRFAADKLGCAHIFIDNLTKVIRSESDFDGQKAFVDDLCTVARDHRIHIHLVAHTRKTDSEYSMPDKFDVRGSQAIVDQVDNVCGVWRHKKKEDALNDPKLDPVKRAEWELRPDTLLLVNKQRNFEWEGRVGLYLHAPSMSFLERPKQPHPMPQLFDVKKQEDVDEVPF